MLAPIPKELWLSFFLNLFCYFPFLYEKAKLSIGPELTTLENTIVFKKYYKVSYLIYYT